MIYKKAALSFSITLILSAFLLFSIQPLFTKMILPLLGGSASVWNTAMVFFQAMLLAGYAYAHLTSRYLSIRRQSILHLGILAACAVFLPIAIPAGSHPAPDGNPAYWQLATMMAVVGAPFFIISSSAPMLQRWFSVTDHPEAANPYFLYAASNIGSMAALLSYPVIVEPLMTLPVQTFSWAIGYGLLVLLTGLCAWIVWGSRQNHAPIREQNREAAPSAREKLTWLVLAFIPSSLMLGLTTYITTDIASAPLIWVLPLALYLATFIIVFARKPIITAEYTLSLFTAFFVIMLFLSCSSLFTQKAIFLLVHAMVFFFACLLCHQRLADRRPPARHLTSFYMYMSLGGVLGGMFNAFLAPALFVVPIEYSLMLCAALFVRGFVVAGDAPLLKMPAIGIWRSRSLLLATGTLALMWFSWEVKEKYLYLFSAAAVAATLTTMRLKPLSFAVFGSVMLMIFSPLNLFSQTKILAMDRNFFGVLRVSDGSAVRGLLNGTTLHGAQPLAPEYRLTPVTYYSKNGPLGDLFRLLDARPGAQKIAVIGLGTGTIACYSRPGRAFDFYEINPDVIKIAEDQTLFTYLSDCGSPYKTILGDGRLKIAEAPDASYDAIILDAFSSDNIPVHLLTVEAFRIYMKKLKPGGLMISHISNRHLDLEPVLESISRATGIPAAIRTSRAKPVAPGSRLYDSAAIYVAMTQSGDDLMTLYKNDGWNVLHAPPGYRAWTDDYANIAAALHFFHAP
jgi:hypothetical protein